MDLEVERSLLFTQLLCPPLPLICRNQGTRDEKITNSNDLMHSIFGRLLSIPNDALELCYPDEGFKGNWKAHILKGGHAMHLLETMVAQSNANPNANWDDATLYPLFCSYCREVIRLLVGYDLASQVSKNMSQNMAKSGYDGAGDIRFLSDPGRVSFSMYPSLVKQSIDHHMAMLVFRITDMPEEVIESIRKELMDRRDYMYTLTKSMGLTRSFAQDIIDYERGD